MQIWVEEKINKWMTSVSVYGEMQTMISFVHVRMVGLEWEAILLQTVVIIFPTDQTDNFIHKCVHLQKTVKAFSIGNRKLICARLCPVGAAADDNGAGEVDCLFLKLGAQCKYTQECALLRIFACSLFEFYISICANSLGSFLISFFRYIVS